MHLDPGMVGWVRAGNEPECLSRSVNFLSEGSGAPLTILNEGID